MHLTSALQKYLMDLPNSRTQEREGEQLFVFAVTFEIHVHVPQRILLGCG